MKKSSITIIMPRRVNTSIHEKLFNCKKNKMISALIPAKIPSRSPFFIQIYDDFTGMRAFQMRDAMQATVKVIAKKKAI